MILCVPVTNDDMVDPRWGRADRIAVAEVVNGEMTSWQEIEVSWSRLHDEGTPARHHARVARFLKDHQIQTVVANHVGDGMVRMVNTMGLTLRLDADGDARSAVLSATE
jgi:predicted Fe-Mo cluster-binding NifX family protein